jgi:hypothetical protein
LHGSDTEELSTDSRTFLQKTARSIVEIQPNLDSIADIVVFLEVLGYTNKIVTDNGFKDLYDFAGHLYEFIDHYVDRKATILANEESLPLSIPSLGRRLFEALSLAFPWLGSLTVLFIFGVSLWLAWGLPLAIATSLIIGVFLGLIASEGSMQLFQRMFTFYYFQQNLSEVKMVLKRSYYLLALIIAGISGTLYAATVLGPLPLQLVSLTAIGALTISIHRTSYIVIYSLRKLGQLVVSYVAALISLLGVYLFLADLIPSAVTRYIDALGTAFIVLSILPAYYSYKLFTAPSISSLSEDRRSPLNPVIVNAKTIKSSFRVQLWEAGPYYLFGTLFFAMLFGDRILSWLFNPIHVVDGFRLPLVFNSVYHIGADLALFVIFPTAIIQYVIMAPISEQLYNLGIEYRVTEDGKVDQFLRHRYSVLALSTLICSTLIATLLIYLAPVLISLIGGSQVSVDILRIAAASNILLSIFMANSLFLTFMNKVRSLVVVAAIGVSIIGVGGFILGQSGFENIVFAYLAAAATTTIISSGLLAGVLRSPSSRYFSKYL